MAKYKIEIDRTLCVGDGACCNEAPKTFEMDGDSIAIVTNADGNTPLKPDVREDNHARSRAAGHAQPATLTAFFRTEG